MSECKSLNALHIMPQLRPTTEKLRPPCAYSIARQAHSEQVTLLPHTPASVPFLAVIPTHASALRAASVVERQVLSSSSPTLHPVITFILHCIPSLQLGLLLRDHLTRAHCSSLASSVVLLFVKTSLTCSNKQQTTTLTVCSKHT